MKTKLIPIEGEINFMKQQFKEVIKASTYKFMRTTFHRLKTAESWRGSVDRSRHFFKEEKEALNAMIAMILVIEYKGKQEEEINLNPLIAYIVLRLFRKSLLWDLKPADKERLMEKFEAFERAADHYVRTNLEQNTSEEFAATLYDLASQVTQKELELYEVAKHYANFVEFNHLEIDSLSDNKTSIKHALLVKLAETKVFEYIDSAFGNLIEKFSWSRNLIRWQGCGATLDCNILCHMLETAVLGWFIAIENLSDEDMPNISPQLAFLIGLYHDVSEIWTNDIPSNCKNEIGEADAHLRPATEELEREALEMHFFPALPEYAREFFREYVMVEDADHEEMHKFLKKADYFSADFEVYWFIFQGSRNVLFLNVMKKSFDGRIRSKCSNELLQEMISLSENNSFRDP